MEIRYKFLSTGSMTYSSSNVYCEGGNLKVNGEEHIFVVEMRTVSLEINTIHVAFRNDGTIQDLESREALPSRCGQGVTCGTSKEAYVFRAAPPTCPLKLIKKIRVSLQEVHIDGQPRNVLYSNVSKIFLPLKGSGAVPPKCK